jgi:hypothetical protein
MKTILLTAVIAALAAAMPSNGICLDLPTEKVVLTIRGDGVRNTNVGDTAQFDMPMLDALEGRTAVVDTPWIKGTSTFSGPYLRSVLKAAGVTGTTLRVSAINDYSSDIPLEDAELDVILATRLGGKPMSVRDKGPIFLVYPFDLQPDLYMEKYFSRSVWQINEIEVR